MTDYYLDCDAFALHITERSATTLRFAVVSRYHPRPQVSFREFNFVTKQLAAARDQPVTLPSVPLSALVFKNNLLVLLSNSLFELKFNSFEQREQPLPFTAHRLHVGYISSQLGDIYSYDDHLQFERLGRGAPALEILRVGEHLLLAAQLRFQMFEIKDDQGDESLQLEHEQAMDAEVAAEREDTLIIAQGSKIYEVGTDAELRTIFECEHAITSVHGACVGTVEGSIFYNEEPVASFHGSCVACAEEYGCCIAASDLCELAIWWQ